MNLVELKKEIQKYQYFEDTNVIDIAIASVVATRLKIGDPVWMIIIGASSGGKSQILRPLSLTDPKFLHRVDDLTENTFLSGMGGGDVSLLSRIGAKGMIVVSDFTVIFSKAKEAKASILSQFRMIYDGEMTKFVGNKKEPVKWKGYLGVLAGSTPSIYGHFEEVADMGERFIYYRMKDYDPEKATRLAMKRSLYGKELDDRLALLYEEYISEIVKGAPETIELPEDIKERILQISMFAEKVRTVAHMDFRKVYIDKIPVSAMPMRIALQLTSIAKALFVMRGGKLTEEDLNIVDWCGYSLANEEKRACLRIFAQADSEAVLSTQAVADEIGLDTNVIGSILQNMSAVGVLKRTGDSTSHKWKIKNKNDWEVIRRIENIDKILVFEDRQAVEGDGDSFTASIEKEWRGF